MSLRILFADDSVTAQNMGKKILTEAGYEVVAVSNGAAAVKKIAEQKPDIIILDVYMPGYTGLEVCEKVRASAATVKTPVLLTVGKMEPYKPEDARRVRADGVIIKPFEASDLLAIIKKFEERIAAMPPPPAPPVVRPVEEIAVTPVEEHHEHHEPQPARNLQPMVEVPDHMASSSAFSDLLGGEAAHGMGHMVAAPPPPPPPAAAVATEPAPTPIQETEIPVSWRPDVEPEPMIMDTPARVIAPPMPPPVANAAPLPTSAPIQATAAVIEPAAVAAPAAIPAAPLPAPIQAAAVAEPAEAAPPAPIPTGPVLARPKMIPVYQEPEAPAGEHEVVPTAAGPIGDVDIPREPQLQETAEEITRETVAEAREPQLQASAEEITRETVADVREPALVPTQQTAEPTPVLAAAASAPSAVSAEAPAPVAETASAPRGGIADTDFEARVAAALAAYNHQARPDVLASAAVEPPAPVLPAAIETAPQAAQAAPPSFEYNPPVTVPEPPPAPVAAAVEAAPAAVVAPAPEAAPAPVAHEEPTIEVPPASATHDAVVAKLEEKLPEAAAAVASAAGSEHDSISDAVNRVMERMKGDLVQEIVRELKSKK
ncbi:MAG: response regulator [Acidobacteriia bacterium]|nr:response regulator [Terriglobia bacterium]